MKSKLFDKIIIYLTASEYRLVFVGALLVGVICGIVAIFAGVALLYVAVGCLAVALVANLVETMQTRVEFNRRVYEMQAEHYKKYLEDGAETVGEIPSAFSAEEFEHIKKERRNFVLSILIKVALILAILIMLF
jgi:hypothetical protein